MDVRHARIIEEHWLGVDLLAASLISEGSHGSLWILRSIAKDLMNSAARLSSGKAVVSWAPGLAELRTS